MDDGKAVTHEEPAAGRSGNRYNRILVKLSGEALLGRQAFGTDPEVVDYVAGEIYDVWQHGVETALVIGGGNIFRGVKAAARGMDRATADYVGMLATVMNAITIQEALEKLGVVTRVQSAISMSQLAEPYIRRRAIRHLEKGRVVIFAAGTGNPYFTTDTAAALRAMEIGAEIMIKATKVDGVYTADPQTDPAAQRLESLSYDDMIIRELRVIDLTAVTLCKDNGLPLVIFDHRQKGALRRLIAGETVGSLVSVKGGT
ncbi:MAG: UMP kinase [Candidatus Schekmanbacteria bacterium]|nr:UMP kinase [Candidatus Schekmanbacteria bacterium]